MNDDFASAVTINNARACKCIECDGWTVSFLIAVRLLDKYGWCLNSAKQTNNNSSSDNEMKIGKRQQQQQH